jgi:hypothetical protein
MTFDRARRARRLLAALLVGAATSIAAPARAEPTAEDLASARELYKEGRALREQGDLPRALEKLRAAHALGQTPITGLELARTYVLVGKLVEAHEVSIGVARLPVASDETEKSVAARAGAAQLASELEPRLARLVITVSGAAPGAAVTVRVDGERVPAEALGEPRSVNPGAHAIVLEVSGAQTTTQAELKEGETRTIPLDAAGLAAPPPVTAPPATSAAPPETTPAAESPPDTSPEMVHPRAHSNLIVVTGLTVTGFGLVFGAAFGVAAINAKGSLQNDCPGGACGPTHYGELSTAQTDGNIATAAFVVAGVGAGAAILDLLLRPKSAPSQAWLQPDVGLGWAGAHGTF